MIPPLHIYFHIPQPLFKARVNMSSVTYPIMELVYDGVTLGDFNDIQFDATLTLGTTEGGSDLGRVRVQKPLHTVDTIYIARSSMGVEDGTLDVQNDAYITVWEDYRVWAKLPWFDLDNGIDFKDGDVPVGDNNTNLPPVSNAGPGCATYVDTGTLKATIQFPQDGINNSFAMADGATIVSHSWNVGDGVITVGDATSETITADFEAGFRYVAHTVVDSNGKSHTSRTPVLTIDKNNDPTIKNFTASQSMKITGQTLDVEIYDELPRDTYPDGTLVMFWWGNEMDNPGSRVHMKFTGWVDGENSTISRDKRGLKKSTKLHCLDITGRLDKLPGFPQALSRVEDESPWSYMPSLDMSKSLWYLLFWHSTAISIADFILPVDGGDYEAMRIDASGATLFQQVNSQANKMVPDHYLTCNSRGQMNFLRNWMLDDVEDRPAIYHSITEGFWNNLKFEYSRHPKVHVLRSGAILASTDWIQVEGEDTLPLAFSVAPGGGSAFGQGTREQVESEGLALSQEALNRSEGHRYALLNNRYGEFSFEDPSGVWFWQYEPALLRRIEFTIGADKAAQRGLDFTEASGLIKEVSVKYDRKKEGTTIDVSVQWEKEVEGYPALTFIPETGETIPYVPPAPAPDTEPAPDFGLLNDTEQVAGITRIGSIVRTSNFKNVSPTWEQIVINESVFRSCLDFIVDPFSPGYQGVPGGAINGFAIGQTPVGANIGIFKVGDIFGTTPTVAELARTTLPGISRYAIAVSSGRFEEVESNNPWVMAVYVANETGAVATDAVYINYSRDGGQTWSGDIKIGSTPSSSDRGAKQNPSVWLSPRTPGLAFVFAFDTPTTTTGFVTTDWGATWTQATNPLLDNSQEFGGSIHVPWNDNEDESIVYHGWYESAANAWKLMRVTGTTVEDISPVLGGDSFGVVKGTFAIRAFDDNRQIMVFGGASTSGTSFPDRFHLFFSTDAGDTWVSKKERDPDPTFGDSVAPGWQVIFSGDDSNMLYVWGAKTNYSLPLIELTSDFGATFQDKSGNLQALSDIKYFEQIMSIAGGPHEPAPQNEFWLEGDVDPVNAIAAYQAIGATDLADSYINLANPGTFDAAPGVAPAWGTDTGWRFNGTQYLTTGVTPATGWSMIVRFSEVSSVGSIAGETGGGSTRFYLFPRYTGDVILYGYSGSAQVAPMLLEGTLAICGNDGYRNGVSHGVTAGNTIGVHPITIGALNSAGVINFHAIARVQAIAIYDTILTPTQVAAIHAAMMAL